MNGIQNSGNDQVQPNITPSASTSCVVSLSTPLRLSTQEVKVLVEVGASIGPQLLIFLSSVRLVWIVNQEKEIKSLFSRLKKSSFLKLMLLLNFLIRWYLNILNLFNISLMLNKCINLWFSIDVTSRFLKDSYFKLFINAVLSFLTSFWHN